jgi:hypothetical protein
MMAIRPRARNDARPTKSRPPYHYANNPQYRLSVFSASVGVIGDHLRPNEKRSRRVFPEFSSEPKKSSDTEGAEWRRRS